MAHRGSSCDLTDMIRQQYLYIATYACPLNRPWKNQQDCSPDIGDIGDTEKDKVIPAEFSL